MMSPQESGDIHRSSQTTPLESLSERLTFPEEEAQVTALTTLYNTVDTSKLLLSDIRHGLRITFENNDAEESGLVSKWRQKDRLKTTAVALVVCLNIGVDPPDVIKISPCARMECWIDPLSMQAPKALDTIGKNLQAQYERWQPRAKYKMHLDPTTDDVKKLVTSCRRSAKSERVLFHYNGHGVPRPTANGEIWVFNKSYTQYIPLSIYDLQNWMGDPAIYIFDCSIAGQILSSFKQFSSSNRDQWQDGQEGVSKNDSSNPLQDVILMCACSENELLPQEPNFPADVFTACLTTPIKIALHWFCSKSLLGNEGITKELIDRIPGKQTDRKTPLGELNWIFTAITDTIAWNVLPRSLFQKLFRQDLLVASLFRNFLLAQRIMRSVGCTPVSHPRLPLMDQHPMWLAWDMAAETCLLQLPDILDDSRGEKEYVPSPFFSEQLTAFELWLDHGSADKPPPEQLPIVLQVLLSQVHRLRALILLGRFIDMGCWAVDLALSVGIFPYILKLLQTSAMDLRQTLVFIWAKIVSWDMNSQVQNDLTKDGGYLYFIKHLELEDSDIFPESRAQAAFILSAICKNNKKGQLLCAQAGLLQTCCSQIPAIAAAMASAVTSDGGQQMELLLKWLLICVGQLCEDVPEIVNLAYEHHLFDSLMDLATADSPNIRAAAIYSLGTAFNVGCDTEVSDEPSEIEKSVICRVLEGVYDGSPLVRGETVRTLYRAAASHPSWVNRELAVALKRNMASRGQTDVACMSAPDLTQLHYQSNSLQANLPSQKEVGTSLPHVDDDEQVPSIQDIEGHDPVARLLLEGLSVLSDDPSLDVRTQAYQTLVELGIELPGRAHHIQKPTGTADMSTPTVKTTGPASVGMSSFLPKSWQAKSWRSFSTPTIKSLPSERSSILNSNSSQVTQVDIEKELSSSTISRHGKRDIVSPITQISHQKLKWPLLSPLAEEEPGVSWLKPCPPNKLKLREQLKHSGIAKCRKSYKVRLKENVHAIHTNGAALESIFLEPFKTQLVTADALGKVRVFDYLQAKLLNEFDSNRDSSRVSAISTMFRLNDMFNELMLACSQNGRVVAWRYYARPGCELQATSWQAMNPEGVLHQPAKYALSKEYLGGSLFSTTYKPKTGKKAVNIWDLHREYCVNEIVSSSMEKRKYKQIEASKMGSQLYSLSADGQLELFDLRSNKCIGKHNIGDDVVGIIPELTGNERCVISGHRSGRINFFDNRMNTGDPCLILNQNIDGHSKGTMTVIHAHSNAPIFTTATSSQVVKVWSANGEQLGVVRAHTSILGHPVGPAKCLAFSPFSLKLASGGEDSVCAVYSLEPVPGS